MDIGEWEILPRDGFLGYNEDCEEKIFAASKRSSNPKCLFQMDYFKCPSSPPSNPRVMVPHQLVPIQLESATAVKEPEPEDEISKEITKVLPLSFVPSVIMPKEIKDPVIGSKETNQDPVPDQVSFKKMKDHEFVDMILDSPKSCTKGFVPPQIDAGMFNFGDKTEAYRGDQAMETTKISSPKIKNESKENMVEEIMWEENSGGLNLWKWSLNGIGAICSFGIAAATVCVIIFGSHQRNKQQQQHNKNLTFQIYTDDKRIKQVVHHATKLNEAISTVRGVPISRAHITIGGYHDGL